MRHVKYICDCCGKEFDDLDTNNLAGLYFAPGYGSKYDGEEIYADLCIDCMDKIIDMLNIKHEE